MTTEATELTESQAKVLSLIEDKKIAESLAMFWTLAEKAPEKARDIIMQYKDVVAAMKEANKLLQEEVDKFNTVVERINTIGDMSAKIETWNKVMKGVDPQNHCLNRMNAIKIACEHVAEIEKLGTLDKVLNILAQHSKEG